MEKTHWLRLDHRKGTLEMVISGIQAPIDQCRKSMDQIDWYDGLWYLEETEPLYGLVLIAFQNYINSSIYDRFQSIEKKNSLYKNGDTIPEKNRTYIELIICLANYYKHRDDDRSLHPGTAKVLDDLQIPFSNIEIEESPIFKGMDLLSINWNLSEISKRLFDWRESLWK